MRIQNRRKRAGNVLVLTIFLMVAMFAMLALTVDLGYINVARTELQRSADAAAIAAAWELADEDVLTGYDNPVYKEYSIRTKAGEFAALNKVTLQSPSLATEDVVIGYIANPLDPTSPLLQNALQPFNAVQVSIHKTAAQNGKIPYFFAKALGMDGTTSEAEATAALLNNIRGFTSPSSGRRLKILPFALDKETWDAMLDGCADDTCGWDSDRGIVTCQPDGIPEVNLFPQDTGAPGNRGTVDIGSSNNSTADIARQILEGISAKDLERYDGKLVLDCNGELFLNGDTGISAGVKDELASIIGEKRIIPLFSDVSGPGNNAEYTIVCFAGVRIMEVKLTGKMSGKKVLVQPACVFTQGVIPADGPAVSQFVFSPVWLVR